MRTFFIFISLVFAYLNNFAQSKDEIAVRRILDNQVAAWNAGRIDNFMEGYWHNDSLLFIGKSGLTYGWQQTLDNYKKHYPDTAAMGKLTLNLSELKSLSSLYYFIVGKWHLQRSVGDAEGHFSLLLEKINGVWFIIVDHSS